MDDSTPISAQYHDRDGHRDCRNNNRGNNPVEEVEAENKFDLWERLLCFSRMSRRAMIPPSAVRPAGGRGPSAAAPRTEAAAAAAFWEQSRSERQRGGEEGRGAGRWAGIPPKGDSYQTAPPSRFFPAGYVAARAAFSSQVLLVLLTVAAVMLWSSLSQHLLLLMTSGRLVACHLPGEASAR